MLCEGNCSLHKRIQDDETNLEKFENEMLAKISGRSKIIRFEITRFTVRV